MAWFKCGSGGGMPSGLQSDMNAVLNKKFGTSGQNYPSAGWPDDVNLMGPLEEKTVSGAIASFADGADDVPIKSASFGIVASGGGGTPSSPVPIVGKSSVTVYHTGKNMFPAPTVGTYTHRWLTATVTSDGKITLSGTNSNGQNATINVPLSSAILVNREIYVHFRNTGGNNSLTVNFGTGGKSTYPNNRILAVTPTFGQDYITIYSAATVSDANFEMQISFEETNEITDFTAYKAKTPITIQLGQTVYGGTLAEDGTLTLTYVKLNLWELQCTRLETSVSGKYRFALTTQNLSAPSTSVATTGICNVAQSISADYLYGAHDGIAVRNSTTIHMYDENYASDTALNFKAHLEEIGAVAVLPLRTSAYTVITGLDEISLSTYLGDNNIWCDSGDSELIYRGQGTAQVYPTAEEASF